ncbi:hypothetical protein jhhlp_003804 [Lomentospora prolificans]|uniref:DNA2/NAM7 helicase-like C-terminal domain-containing protein n=1 Tax=Lomentospora prolificans TaxID=41688 RepID=A0A2N3N9S6_9PEZI|nr:hypothetical protein jhhlp_003804 [Lomentospora prolificans]
MTDKLANFKPEDLALQNSIEVVLRLEMNVTSYLAEMSALDHLAGDREKDARQGPSPSSVDAFEWMLDFTKKPKRIVNLFKHLPHMEDPEASGVPHELVQMYKALNQDHLAAYRGLAEIPERLYMVSGCPGAGKTHWNILVVAIAQSVPVKTRVDQDKSRSRQVKVLYLIDVNKPTDDSANRMHRLCREAGLKKTVIRLHGWPYEMRRSDFINGDSSQGALDGIQTNQTRRIDFSRQFVMMAQAHEIPRTAATDENRAPSLDEAAWDYYNQHKDQQYPELAISLQRLLKVGVQSPREQVALRRCVYKVYSDVLRTADFVATTPVSAYGRFPQMFHPDIIFLDEAPHARELTSLIPIAFFSPRAWVYTGDFRQTRPFVADAAHTSQKGTCMLQNPFAKQLTISTMERAERVGAPVKNLLINHRAYGALEKLASQLFYDGRMRSGIPFGRQFPSTVLRLQGYLENLARRKLASESRLVVDLIGSSEDRKMSSFYNEVHETWALKRVKELLRDMKFRRVDKTNEPGSIMIIAPYRAAVANYRSLIRDLGDQAKGRVEVRTIDTAQGHEADLVILDLVRTSKSGFLDDPHRLNVAITRARQAEIILMCPEITRRQVGGKVEDTNYLLKMWKECDKRGILTTLQP